MLVYFLVLLSSPGRILSIAEDYTDGPRESWHRREIVVFWEDNATEPVEVYGKTSGPLLGGRVDARLGGTDSRKLVSFTDRIEKRGRILETRKLSDKKTRRSVPDGDRSILIVMLNYTDTTPADYCDWHCVYDQMWGVDITQTTQGTNEFFKAISFNRIGFPASDSALVSIAMGTAASDISGCPVETMASSAVSQWSTLTRVSHFVGSTVSAGYSPGDFDHVAFYLPANTGTFQCLFLGSAYVNACNDATNVYCRIWMRTSSASTLAHELGHNIGLHHATDDPNDDRILASASDEYGDGSDVMGSASHVVSVNRPHLEALGYHTGRTGSADATLTVDNFFACSTDLRTIVISATSLDPVDVPTGQVSAVRFFRVPSTSEQSDTSAYCASHTCECGSSWRTTLFYDSEFSVQRVEYIYYYISYRSSTTGVDANLGASLQQKVYVHTYSPNTSSYWVDRTFLVATLGSGQTKALSRTGATISVTAANATAATVTLQFDCASGTTRPSCSECSEYACSDPITSSSTSAADVSAGASAASGSSSSGLSAGAITGISIGAVLSAFVLILVAKWSLGTRRGEYDRLSNLEFKMNELTSQP